MTNSIGRSTPPPEFPPPANVGPSTPTAGSSAPRRAATTRSAVRPPVRKQTQSPRRHAPTVPAGALPDLHVVHARDCAAVALCEGKLYAWNRRTGRWQAVPQEHPAKALHRAGDDRFHLLLADGRLVPLDDDGQPQPARAVVLPSDTNTFTVSPGGKVAFVRETSPPLIGTIAPRPTADSREAADAPDTPDAPTRIVWSSSPLEHAVHGIAALAFDGDGRLLALDKAGGVARAEAAELPRDGDEMTRVWRTLPTTLRGADPRHQVKFTALDLRPDGTVGATDERGAAYKLDKEDGAWEATDIRAPVAAQAMYGGLRTGPRAGWEASGLGTPLGPMAPGDTLLAQHWHKFSMLSRTENRSLIQRHADWIQAHQPFRRTGTGHIAEKNRLARTMTVNLNLLRHPGDLPRRDWMGEVASLALRQPITQRSLDMLQSLRRELGLSDGPELTAADQRSPAYQRVRSTRDLVRSEDNVLHVLHAFRMATCGEDDEVARELKVLLDKNVFLGLDGTDGTVGHLRNAAGMLAPHERRNKQAVLTAKLLHDHAVLAVALGSAESAEDAVLAARLLDHEPATGRKNDITLLVDQGFIDIKAVHKFLDAHDYLTAALRERHHKIQRALTSQGLLQDNIVDAYTDMVRAMAPGTSIAVDASAGGGLDLGGMSLFMKFKAIPLLSGALSAQAFAIEPENQVNVTFTHPLKIEKQAGGDVKITFGSTESWTALPFAFKSQHGVGGSVQAPGGMLTAFLYAGFNVKARIGIARTAAAETSLVFAKDDTGTVAKVMNGLLTGGVQPFELLGMARNVENVRARDETVTFALDLEPLLAAGLVGSVDGTSDYHHQNKAISAAVGQVNFSSKRIKTDATARQSTGAHTARTDTHWDHAIGATLIGVLEAQYANAYDVPHGERNGGETQFKAPLAIIVLSKNFFGTNVVANGFTEHFDRDGALTNVTVDYTARNTGESNSIIKEIRRAVSQPNSGLDPKTMPALGTLMRGAPEVAALLEKMIDSRLPITVSMEMKPAAMALVRSYFQDGPDNKRTTAEMQVYIANLMKNPDNLRITNLSVMEKRTYKTGASAGLGPLRYQSNAENTLNSIAGTIGIAYDDAGKPTATSSGRLFHAPDAVPDVAHLRAVLHHGGPSLLAALSDLPARAADLSPAQLTMLAEALPGWRDQDEPQLDTEQRDALGALLGEKDPAAIQRVAVTLGNDPRSHAIVSDAIAQTQARAQATEAPVGRLRRMIPWSGGSARTAAPAVADRRTAGVAGGAGPAQAAGSAAARDGEHDAPVAGPSRTVTAETAPAPAPMPASATEQRLVQAALEEAGAQRHLIEAKTDKLAREQLLRRADGVLAAMGEALEAAQKPSAVLLKPERVQQKTDSIRLLDGDTTVVLRSFLVEAVRALRPFVEETAQTRLAAARLDGAPAAEIAFLKQAQDATTAVTQRLTSLMERLDRKEAPRALG